MQSSPAVNYESFLYIYPGPVVTLLTKRQKKNFQAADRLPARNATITCVMVVLQGAARKALNLHIFGNLLKGYNIFLWKDFL